MKLIQRILTKSGCYRAGRKIAVKGLMIHSVGCPQPKASAFISNWDKADAGACVHAIVEPGGDVYQLLPWDCRGWHCGCWIVRRGDKQIQIKKGLPQSLKGYDSIGYSLFSCGNYRMK